MRYKVVKIGRDYLVVGDRLYPTLEEGKLDPVYAFEKGQRVPRGTRIYLDSIFDIKADRVLYVETSKDKVEVWRFTADYFRGRKRGKVTWTSLDCFPYLESGPHVGEQVRTSTQILTDRRNENYHALVLHVNTEGEVTEKHTEKLIEMSEDASIDAIIINTRVPTTDGFRSYPTVCLEQNLVTDYKGFNDKSPWFNKKVMEARVSIIAGANPSYTELGDEEGTSTENLMAFFAKDGNMILAPCINLDAVVPTEYEIKGGEIVEVDLKLNVLRFPGDLRVCGLPCVPEVRVKRLRNAA